MKHSAHVPAHVPPGVSVPHYPAPPAAAPTAHPHAYSRRPARPWVAAAVLTICLLCLTACGSNYSGDPGTAQDSSGAAPTDEARAGPETGNDNTGADETADAAVDAIGRCPDEADVSKAIRHDVSFDQYRSGNEDLNDGQLCVYLAQDPNGGIDLENLWAASIGFGAGDPPSNLTEARVSAEEGVEAFGGAVVDAPGGRYAQASFMQYGGGAEFTNCTLVTLAPDDATVIRIDAGGSSVESPERMCDRTLRFANLLKE